MKNILNLNNYKILFQIGIKSKITGKYLYKNNFIFLLLNSFNIFLYLKHKPYTQEFQPYIFFLKYF